MPRPSIIQVFEGHVLCFLIPTSFPYNRDRMRLDIDLAPNRKNNLSLRNPVLTASGTFGNGLEYVKLIDVETLGAIVSKAVTLKPRIGNRQPRLLETAAGMLNSIGLQNMGVKALIQDVAPIWATWSVPVIVNLAGETVSDYARLAYELDDVPGVSGLELNISCPNVESGLEFGTDPNLAAVVTKAVRRETALPLIVKLTPNTERIAEVAMSVTDEGADSLTVANTFPAMAIDADRQLPALGWGGGWPFGASPEANQSEAGLRNCLGRQRPHNRVWGHNAWAGCLGLPLCWSYCSPSRYSYILQPRSCVGYSGRVEEVAQIQRFRRGL